MQGTLCVSRAVARQSHVCAAEPSGSGSKSSVKQQRLASARKRWPEHIRDEEKLHWWDTTDRQGIMQGAETATGTNRGEEVPPWTLGFQMSERYITWTSDMRVGIVMDFAAKELGIKREEVEDRIRTIITLVPDLEAKLPVLKADLVAALCRDLTGIAERIMELGEALPGSNIGVLVANRPGMLLDPPERIAEYRQRAAEMRRVFPKINVGRMLQDQPTLLDIRDVAQARKDLERVFGGKTDIDAMVARDPNWLQEVQRGDGLIPYDDPADEWEKTGD